jgi:hypothetical protein
LANHKSIRASRYAAAAAGSQVPDVPPEGACCAATVAADTVSASAIASFMDARIALVDSHCPVSRGFSVDEGRRKEIRQ